MSELKRPTGVTILAILSIIAGILMIIGGISLTVLLTTVGVMQTMPGLGLLTAVGALSGIIIVIMGLLAIAVGWGFLKGSKWSWVLAIILLVLSLISGLASLVVGAWNSIVGVIIDLLILYYLFRPNVKTWFSK